MWLRFAIALVVVAAAATVVYVRVSSNVVFSDDFKNHSGWFTGADTAGVTFEYTSAGYRVSGPGSTPYEFTSVLVGPPFLRQLPKISMTATALLSPGAEGGAGFGVACERGRDPNHFSYEFSLNARWEWVVLVRTGPNWMNSSMPPVLRKGIAPKRAGPTPVTMTGSCMTDKDGRTTRLVLVVDGSKVADFADTISTSTSEGWLADFDGVFTRTPSAVTATYFEERDLSR